ncbi:sensor histidine kinase [Actinomadura madurae]
MATDIVLGQLLENAFKYSPDGGTVSVRARREGSRIVVTVTDEGIGIPDGDHERIFERFVQGDAGDRRRFGGIGLGLYIVRRLTEAQGGTISAQPAGREASHTESGHGAINGTGGAEPPELDRATRLLPVTERRGPAGGARAGEGTCMRLVLRAAG